MYAVVVTGGKQYKVATNQFFKVEKIEAQVGETITLDNVLLIADGDNVVIGTPKVEGATVSAVVTEQYRHKKVRIIKFRRRKHHMKRQGHRQWYTELKITAINK